MTLTRFATKNAFRNKRRSLLTSLSIGFSLLLLTLLMSIYRGFYLDKGSEASNLRLVARPEVGWALGSRAAATAAYFALLFVIALYLQQGLGMSPLYSGCALVSWVSAFGLDAFVLFNK